MSGLLPPDFHHLSAAEGWLELGNRPEALLELDLISIKEQERIEVLALRWAIQAENCDWDQCLGIAERIVARAPKKVFGWIHRSFALHELQRTKEARDFLLPAVRQFPKDQTIPYNLACYECQLGNLESAKDWLRRALQLRSPAELKEQALKDLDLEPLWSEIARMPISAQRRPAGA